ncbi:MAG: 2Fe-2S iron-sulfur cluster-binding protein [Bradymonadia bacterium]
MPKIVFLPTFLTKDPISVDVEEGVSLQEAAFDAGVPMGDACGGNCGCSTCHVFVTDGESTLSEMEDDEDDVLGKADDVRLESRLGCQAFVGTGDVTVQISRESQQAFINEHPEYRDRVGDIID